MSGFIMLLWISIIVILNVHGEDMNAKSNLCEHCNSNTVPECVEADFMAYNFTIHCQQADETPCVIAMTKNMGENKETEYICLVKQHEFLENNFVETKKLNAKMEEQQTTMIMESITEAIVIENQKSMELDNDNKVVEENDAIPRQFETAVQSIIEDTMKLATTEAGINTENGNIVSDMNAVTEKPADSTDQSITVATTISDNSAHAQKDVEMETSQRPDLNDLPQADQPMPEVHTVDEKPLIEIGNGIESPDVENTNSMPSEKVETTHELEPKMNSIENVATVMPIGTIVKCFGCVSTKDSNCIKKPEIEVACKSMGPTPVGCFTLIKDTQIIRGCLEDLDVQQTTQCLDSEDKRCHVCFGDSCNDESWPQCYVCNSNPENPLCAQWSPQVLLAPLTKVCPSFDDVCRMEITENGGTIRSCVAKSVECDIAQVANCKICNMSLCNGGVFPMGRLHCCQCADTSNCTLEQEANISLPCPIFTNDDSCFLYVNSVGKMQRGCRSSVDDFKHCMEYDARRCRTCNTSDGCNSQALMLEPQLSCSKCDTRVRNAPSSVSCAWAQPMESVSPCKDRYLYFLEETCEMIYQPDIEMAVRGCSNDIGFCDKSYKACRDCKAKACNIGNFVWQYCLQCSSEEVENCGSTAMGITAEKCKLSMQSYETRGCYTSISWDKNVTTRGCISDLTDDEKNYCNANKKLCTFCYEQGCNSLSALSSGNQMFMENGFRFLLFGLIYSFA